MPLGEPAEGLRDVGLVDETQVPGAVEGRDGGSRFLAPDGSHDRADDVDGRRACRQRCGPPVSDDVGLSRREAAAVRRHLDVQSRIREDVHAERPQQRYAVQAVTRSSSAKQVGMRVPREVTVPTCAYESAGGHGVVNVPTSHPGVAELPPRKGVGGECVSRHAPQGDGSGGDACRGGTDLGSSASIPRPGRSRRRPCARSSGPVPGYLRPARYRPCCAIRGVLSPGGRSGPRLTGPRGIPPRLEPAERLE